MIVKIWTAVFLALVIVAVNAAITSHHIPMNDSILSMSTKMQKTNTAELYNCTISHNECTEKTLSLKKNITELPTSETLLLGMAVKIIQCQWCTKYCGLTVNRLAESGSRKVPYIERQESCTDQLGV